nr:splicing factor U2af small subunit A-like isoform X2 [Lolium perenne]
MAKYDYGSPSPSPSPSPPPADIHANHLQRASLSDLLLHLHRRANSGPADGHSRHRQQQQVLHAINMDHRIPPVRMPDGTTRRCEIMCVGPHCPEAPAVAYPRHRYRAATPYDRPENHVCWSSRPRRQSPAPHDQGVTNVVCVAKMISPVDPLEDDEFYRDFLENVTEDAGKFGDLVKVVIPRPCPGIGGRATPVVAGVGKVFLEYAHVDDAAWCRRRMDGLRYGGKEIHAEFFPQSKFAAGEYE